MNNSTIECESFEHQLISITKPNQGPDIDISIIATSTPKLLSKILPEVSIRCKRRTTQLPTIQINSPDSKILGSSSIQKKDFKKKRKKDFKMFNQKHVPTSEDIGNQVKQLCLEPESDLSLPSSLEDSI